MEYKFKTALEKFIVFISVDKSKPLFESTDEEISNICSKFKITFKKKLNKMVITIKDSNFIDVSKIESLLSKNEAKEIKLKSFITGSMKRRLFIVEEDERSIPYRLCPFEIYNENNISYLRILSTFYTNKVINAILEFEQNKQNIKIFKAQMDQSIAKYITSKVFLPGKNHFIDSIRDKGFYVD